MSSRYGLWFVCVCGIALAGCANWQNRSGNTGIGSAATIQTAAPLGSSAPGVAPGTTFGEPPPPVPPPPSDPNAVLAPLGSEPPQRLDLSASEESGSSRPSKMYNLDTAPAKASASSSSKSAKSASGSSTLSKLAKKAGTSASSSSSEAKSSPSNSNSDLTAIDRLRNASSSRSDAGNSETDATLSKPAQVSPAIVEPAPKAAAKSNDSSAVVDTALLAQPVRKGSSESKKEDGGSKGPQSSVAPGKKLFEMNNAVIYPVSNPTTSSPVDITQFS